MHALDMSSFLFKFFWSPSVQQFYLNWIGINFGLYLYQKKTSAVISKDEIEQMKSDDALPEVRKSGPYSRKNNYKRNSQMENFEWDHRLAYFFFLHRYLLHMPRSRKSGMRLSVIEDFHHLRVAR